MPEVSVGLGSSRFPDGDSETLPVGVVSAGNARKLDTVRADVTVDLSG